MAGDKELRLKAGFAVAKALGTYETRASFKANGYTDGQEIVIALEADTIQSVFGRIQDLTPPVVVAIYWPEKDELTFSHMEPSATPNDYSAERDDVGGATTIGMLYEHIKRQRNMAFRFKLGWGASPAVTMARFDTIPV